MYIKLPERCIVIYLHKNIRLAALRKKKTEQVSISRKSYKSFEITNPLRDQVPGRILYYIGIVWYTKTNSISNSFIDIFTFDTENTSRSFTVLVKGGSAL